MNSEHFINLNRKKMKRHTLKLGLLTLGIFGFSLTMAAQEKKAPDAKKILKRMDADKDGKISLKEFTSVKRKKEIPVERLEKRFAKMDKNRDNVVNYKELKAFFDAPKKGKKKKKHKKQD